MAMKILDQLIKEKKVQPVMKTILTHDTPFSKNKLKKLFSRFEKSLTPKTKKSLPSPEELPEDLQLKLQEVKKNYSVINSLRSKLFDIFYTKRGPIRRSPNRTIAKKICFEIEDLTDKNRALLFEIDYFIEHKKQIDHTKPHNMTDLKRAAFLLNHQVEAVNYIRKQDSKKKKDGSLQNPALYRERKDILKEIKKFIEDHG